VQGIPEVIALPLTNIIRHLETAERGVALRIAIGFTKHLLESRSVGLTAVASECALSGVSVGQVAEALGERSTVCLELSLAGRFVESVGRVSCARISRVTTSIGRDGAYVEELGDNFDVKAGGYI
jgi:hypothetical protein